MVVSDKKGDRELWERVNEVLSETDPDRQIALARRLRAEIWGILGEDDLERIRESGIDVDAVNKALRRLE